MPHPLQDEISAADLLREYSAACADSDALFALIAPQALYERPIPERHRLIFYLGHLEAFDWNLIGKTALTREPIHPTFDQLFAFGIDPPEGQLPQDRPADWPQSEEVGSYVRTVRRTLAPLMTQVSATFLQVAIEHRLMHLETLAYLLHQLPPEKKRFAPPLPPRPGAAFRASAFVGVPAGKATLGRGQGFGWDNEFQEHTVAVPAFSISKHKVTNGDYLAFVEAGAPEPFFWSRANAQAKDGWRLKTMAGEIPLPSNWPVYTTYQQAAAYAGWRGMQLPSEAQFHRAAYGTPEGAEREYPWGSAAPTRERGNFGGVHWDPVAVNATPAGESAFGVEQTVGNGWEWTATPFGPFPGFAPFPFYPGYSRNFFDGGHYVMKGAGPRTPRRLLRRSFRNWFRAEYPYVHAGFRLVES